MRTLYLNSTAQWILASSRILSPGGSTTVGPRVGVWYEANLTYETI